MMQSPPSSPDDTPIQRDVPYSEQFTDELMNAVLDPSSPNGTIVLARNRNRTTNSDSIRIEDAVLPDIGSVELPLPLNDARRIYRSNVPGVRLTHPGGPVEGGPPSQIPSGVLGSDGQIPLEVRQYTQRLIGENDVKSTAQLKRAIAEETQRQMEELKKQMQDRQAAIHANERTAKELETLEVQRTDERKIEEKRRQQRAQDRRDS